ncbi:MAG: hypothetical protein DID89_2727548188, partial [Candidatus Nitrotoga sp. CP45]
MPQLPEWQLQGMGCNRRSTNEALDDGAKIEAAVKTVLNLGQVTVSVFTEIESMVGSTDSCFQVA